MLTPQQADVVARMRREGHGTRAIAKVLDVSRHQVRRYLDNAEKPQANSSAGTLGNPEPLPTYLARQANVHPKGWEPGIRWDKGLGVVTWREGDGENADFESVLAHLGFDPDRYKVVGEVDARTWTMNLGEGELHTARYFRAKIVPSLRDKEFDEELVAALAAKKRITRHYEEPASTLVVNLADWQLGKRDGDGTLGVIERAKTIGPAIGWRLNELSDMGVTIQQVVIAGMGDLFEGCEGHYPQQTYMVEVNRRQQGNIIRQLLFDIIVYVAELGVDVIVVAVPGNHGENRKDGKSFTDFSDNDDLYVFDQLAHVFNVADTYRNVSFVIPTEELSVTLNISGQVVTWTHGHQFKQGSHPAQKLINWLSGQALGRQPAGDSDILNTGHYHFLLIMQDAGRWYIQSPALESDSKWWRDQTGAGSPASTISYVVTPQGPTEFTTL